MKKIFALVLSLCICLSMSSCSYFKELVKENVHFYLSSRECGDCEFLRGNVLITVIFTDDNENIWTDGDISSFKTSLNQAANILLADAKTYGSELNISFNFLRSKTEYSVSRDNNDEWYIDALKSAGFPDESKVITSLKKAYSVDEAPVVFAINRNGRDFATPSNISDDFEYAILYKNATALRHELYHIFGARDLYYPKETKALAKQYFPNSIMLSNNDAAQVDPLTAYVVGFTDTLTEEANSFLEETKQMTLEKYRDALAKETKTGHGVKESDETIYTGDLYEGSFHGQGKLVWKKSKTVLEGTFEYGVPTTGTMTWKDGSVYTGSFENWERNGYGKTVWPNGDQYVGYHKDGKRHGEGTYTFANGKVKSGTWKDNAFVK